MMLRLRNVRRFFLQISSGPFARKCKRLLAPLRALAITEGGVALCEASENQSAMGCHGCHGMPWVDLPEAQDLGCDTADPERHLGPKNWRETSCRWLPRKASQESNSFWNLKKSFGPIFVALKNKGNLLLYFYISRLPSGCS